jgi:hypothetical protein
MSQLKPLNAARHKGWHWKPRGGFAFAATRWLAPIVITELPHVMGDFAVVFQRSSDGRLGVAVLLGLQPGSNEFVNQQHQWQGRYTPAFLRTHPFELAQTEQQSYVVMLDEASPVVDPEGHTGEPILTPDGQPAKVVQPLLAFLKNFATQQIVTDRACQAIDQHQLLVSLQGQETEAPGLYRIDQKKLDALGPQSLETLRNQGALSLAYAQLLSMPRFLELKHRQTSDGGQTTPEQEIDLEQIFGQGDNDMIKF